MTLARDHLRYRRPQPRPDSQTALATPPLRLRRRVPPPPWSAARPMATKPRGSLVCDCDAALSYQVTVPVAGEPCWDSPAKGREPRRSVRVNESLIGSVRCGPSLPGSCRVPAWTTTPSRVSSRLASAIQRTYSLRWVKDMPSKAGLGFAGRSPGQPRAPRAPRPHPARRRARCSHRPGHPRQPDPCTSAHLPVQAKQELTAHAGHARPPRVAVYR